MCLLSLLKRQINISTNVYNKSAIIFSHRVVEMNCHNYPISARQMILVLLLFTWAHGTTYAQIPLDSVFWVEKEDSLSSFSIKPVEADACTGAP